MIYLIILSILIIAAYTAAVCVKQGGVPYLHSRRHFPAERWRIHLQVPADETDVLGRGGGTCGDVYKFVCINLKFKRIWQHLNLRNREKTISRKRR